MSDTVSEYRRNKYRAYFDFLDINRDGHITAANFYNCPKILAGKSKANMQTRLAYQREGLSWWALFQNDQQLKSNIDKDFFVARCCEYHVDPSQTKAEVARHYRFLFDLIDGDSDGKITEAEMMMYYNAYQWTNESHIREIFKKLDKDGSGYVARDEFIHAGVQFWLSDDTVHGCDFL